MPTCKIEGEPDKDVVKMCNMEPLQWGIIESKAACYDGEIVMRTASCNNFEVFSITEFSEDSCWTATCQVNVRLGKGKLKLTIEN